jgi:hypothetical protein
MGCIARVRLQISQALLLSVVMLALLLTLAFTLPQPCPCSLRQTSGPCCSYTPLCLMPCSATSAVAALFLNRQPGDLAYAHKHQLCSHDAVCMACLPACYPL